MPNPFQKFIVDFELDQLSTMMSHIRSKLDELPAGYGIIAAEHFRQASGDYEDALAALRYQNLGQAETMLKQGRLQAYFAYRLVHAVVAFSGGQEGDTHRPAAGGEERISYLGAALGELKKAIEYSNCSVSELAGDQVEKSVRLYDSALGALKDGQELIAKRSAQAGILQLSFAGELIRAENGGALPGWNGLANPLTNCPIRQLNELASAIIHVYLIPLSDRSQAKKRIRTHFLKAVQSLNNAIAVLAQDNTVYAQALVVTGLTEIDRARTLAEPELVDAFAGQEWQTVRLIRKHSEGDVELTVMDIKNILQRSPHRSADKARNRLDALVRNFAAAINALESGDKAEAGRLADSALHELAQVRQTLFKTDGTFAFPLA
jgi:hypothetical protein